MLQIWILGPFSLNTGFWHLLDHLPSTFSITRFDGYNSVISFTTNNLIFYALLSLFMFIHPTNTVIKNSICISMKT